MAQPLKYELTEEDLKKMTNSIIFHLKESFDNPLSMPKELKNNPLMEGYFETYPSEKVEKYDGTTNRAKANVNLVEDLDLDSILDKY